jgi:hypothetical protein
MPRADAGDLDAQQASSVSSTGVNMYSDRISLCGSAIEGMEPRLFYKRFSTYNGRRVTAVSMVCVFHYPSFILRSLSHCIFI